jgi:hypothetical protein
MASMEDQFSADIVELEWPQQMWTFFTIAMSPQGSLLFLLIFVRSSFFARVMIPLLLSLISSLLFGVRLTLLILICLLPLVSHARIRRLLLSLVARMTS